MSIPQEVSDVALAGTPPVVVSSMTFLGFPLSEWIYVVTIFYTLVATFALIKKLWDSHKRDRQNNNNNNHKEKNDN